MQKGKNRRKINGVHIYIIIFLNIVKISRNECTVSYQDNIHNKKTHTLGLQAAGVRPDVLRLCLKKRRRKKGRKSLSPLGRSRFGGKGAVIARKLRAGDG